MFCGRSDLRVKEMKFGVKVIGWGLAFSFGKIFHSKFVLGKKTTWHWSIGG